MTGRFCAALVGLWCASACLGQDVWYITPKSFHPTVAEGLDISISSDAIVGDESSEQSYPADAIDRIFVRGGGRQWNIHDLEPIEAGGVWAHVPMPEVGVGMIGMDCTPLVETYSGAQLSAFIEEHAPSFGHLEVDDEAQEIRVRVVRNAKALVRIRDGRTEHMISPISASKAGQQNEIRLNDDPTLAMVGSEISVRLYADWHSRQGVSFIAENVTAGQRTTVNVNEYGNGPVRINAPGLWRVEFHYLLELDEPDVDFELHSATLTFETPAEGER